MLKGRTILITAGPTYEAIDPVRFIGNHSSGLMGYSLALEAANRGADVILISGPTSLTVSHKRISRIDVVSAEDMFDACMNNFFKANIIIMSAAVADYTPEKFSQSKIKKKQEFVDIKLKPTKDILAELGKIKNKNQVLIGFALETDNEIENAKKKLRNKNLDFIVLNSLNDKGAGFGHATNKVTIIDKQQNIDTFELKSKKEVAIDIIQKVVSLIAS